MTDLVFRSEAAAADVLALYRAVLDRWPVPAERRRIATGQGDTFVLVSGPQHAPPVVLLHGSQANSAAWLPDVALWSQHFRLHAIDMIGEPGLSARVRPPLGGDAHALWLVEVLEALGIARAAFVGTSLGGWLALDYAARRPEAVTALALVCPAGIGRQKNFLLRAAPLLLLGGWGKRKIREMVFGPAPAAMPADLAVIAPLMDSIGSAARPRIVKIPQLTDAQLEALAMPLLVVVGGRDVLIDSLETRARLSAHVPHAQVCFIDQGRHFLPDQSARILAFLQPGAG